jgi:unsaturated rhamnogalacturonyl hydrolase
MRWRYEDGFILHAIARTGTACEDSICLDAAWAYVDGLVSPTGDVTGYRLTEYNLDQVMPGRLLFAAHRETGEPRFQRAICRLVEQLHWQPRTRCAGFWHKLIYPYQMWLDGIYMASPFYAEYAATFDDPVPFDDVGHQISTMERVTRDPDTGLLHHGWDESRQQRWAHPITGRSPHFWSRGMGWYLMALVDVLEYLPPDHFQIQAIAQVLRRTAAALRAVQDPATGLWRQVLNQGDRHGNYFEASGSCMAAYALAKGVRQGFLEACDLDAARRAFAGVRAHLVHEDSSGALHLHGSCDVAGLGAAGSGAPYRDGSYEYYVSERPKIDEPKGVAALMLAALELDDA